MDRPASVRRLGLLRKRHRAPLRDLQNHADDAWQALLRAGSEEEMSAALLDFVSIAEAVGTLFVDGEISQSDMPFEKVKLGVSVGSHDLGKVHDRGGGIGNIHVGSMDEVDLAEHNLFTQKVAAQSAGNYKRARQLHIMYYRIRIWRLNRLCLQMPFPSLPQLPERQDQRAVLFADATFVRRHREMISSVRAHYEDVMEQYPKYLAQEMKVVDYYKKRVLKEVQRYQHVTA